MKNGYNQTQTVLIEPQQLVFIHNQEPKLLFTHTHTHPEPALRQLAQPRTGRAIPHRQTQFEPE